MYCNANSDRHEGISAIKKNIPKFGEGGLEWSINLNFRINLLGARRTMQLHLAFFVFMHLVACGSKTSENAPTDPVDPKRATAANVASLGSGIYNANFVGKPCATVNKSTTCPGGGAVEITGSFSCTTSSTGVQSMNLDLTYSMTNCIEVRSGLTTTLTGIMKHTGSSTNLASVVTSETISYNSSGKVTMTSIGPAYKSLSESCDFALTSRISEAGGTSKVTGTLCEESFGLDQ